MLAILIFLLIFLTSAFWNFVWKRRSLPPGPTPLPLFGNTLQLKRFDSPYSPFQHWAKQFGPVYTIWMGESPVVVVADFEQMKEMFVKDGDTFAGRDFFVELFKMFKISRGVYGVTRTQGENWKVMRRFGIQTMRNLGMGKTGMETQFLKDLSKMIEVLREQALLNEEGNVDFSVTAEIDRLSGSVINRLLFGFAFENNNLKEFRELKDIMKEQQHIFVSPIGRLLHGKPQLRYLPFFGSTFSKLEGNMEKIYSFISRQIEIKLSKRNATADKSEYAPTDLVDYFLDQMELADKEEGQEREPGLQQQEKHFHMENLTNLCWDLFVAGQETTSSTLSFLVLYLLLDQQAQAKLHAELDSLDGEEDFHLEEGQQRQPSIGMAHRAKLPFVNAVINESQRLCNLLPMNLTHRTMRDVTILDGKYRLKEGTIIVPQISCVLYDEKIFPNALQFRPERFLNDLGQLKRYEELIPFGLGKRICMGESLARMELFLFVANFFHHFQVLPCDPLNPPTVKPELGIGVKPKEYRCRLIVRKKAGLSD